MSLSATTMRPDVFLSKRWTIPGRLVPLTSRQLRKVSEKTMNKSGGCYAGTGMDDESGRFIDYDQRIIGVNYGKTTMGSGISSVDTGTGGMAVIVSNSVRIWDGLTIWLLTLTSPFLICTCQEARLQSGNILARKISKADIGLGMIDKKNVFFFHGGINEL